MRSGLILLIVCMLHDAGVKVDAFSSSQQRRTSGKPPTLIGRVDLGTIFTTTTSHHGRALTLTSVHALPTAADVTKAGILGGLSVLASVGVLVAYHIRLAQREAAGKPSWRSSQAQTRQEWSQFVRKTEGWLYAVQTLRNAITANTFLATTVLSLLTVISGKVWEMIQRSTYSVQRSLLIVQFTCIALAMLSSAYQFLQSARLMTHAGFMFPTRQGTKVDRIMRKSQNSQWLGLRWLYISIAVMCWIVGGGSGFLLSSLALVQFFRKIDQVPKGEDDADN